MLFPPLLEFIHVLVALLPIARSARRISVLRFGISVSGPRVSMIRLSRVRSPWLLCGFLFTVDTAPPGIQCPLSWTEPSTGSGVHQNSRARFPNDENKHITIRSVAIFLPFEGTRPRVKVHGLGGSTSS